MDFISIGERIPENLERRLNGRPNSSTFLMENGGTFILLCGLDRITSKELRILKNGTVKIGLNDHFEGLPLLFLTYEHIGNEMNMEFPLVFDENWLDELKEVTDKCNLNENTGIFTTVVVFDTYTHRIVDFRMLGLTTKISEPMLFEGIKQLRHKNNGLDIVQRHIELQQRYDINRLRRHCNHTQYFTKI